MYRALSPIFDVPELPTLRRVKPLPKRRRTSESSPHDDAGHIMSTAPATLDASPDEPPAQTDVLSAQMALQSYYMPVLGGVQELFNNNLNSATSTPIDLGGGSFGQGDFRGAHDDEDVGEGDYIDHLQQPGNTKKRKVPANMVGSAHGHDPGSGNSGAEDELTDRGVPSGGRLDRDYDTIDLHSPSSQSSLLAQKKGKLPKATLAGLQHKEMLKSRKRQLAAVLGALSHGDTLALDQALSANYPLARVGLGGDPHTAPALRVRLSRRHGPRLARAFDAFRASLPAPSVDRKAVALPDADFEFVCHSATSDRLVATKEEVAVLHARFEAELARQAAKAAEAAKQAAAALNGPLSKRADRSKQSRAAGGRGTDQKNIEQSLLGTKDRGGKKKKRSALANASNPHHLRNYVPSRVPHSGQANTTQAVQNAQNLLSPLPLRFLSADIPPRRLKKSESAVIPVSTLANPAEEWICPFCEYSLFYGDEAGFQRAVRNRKKILRRRRRARERAAAAASGTSTMKTSDKDTSNAEDVHPGFETPAADEVGSVGGKQAKWKEERDRGGHGGTQSAPG